MVTSFQFIILGTNGNSDFRLLFQNYFIKLFNVMHEKYKEKSIRDVYTN